MKKSIALLLAALALLLVAMPGGAVAASHHHTKVCPKGKHRSGKKCVKNHVVRGPQGEPGAAGPAGSNGAPGPKGEPGAPGTNGTNGTNGGAGAAGPAGPAGPSGPTGPAGPTGPTGPTGPEGNPPTITRSTVYSNMPATDSAPSYGFAALDFDELGSLIKLAGTDRNNPDVNVLMSVYTCQNGSYNDGTCQTTPGTKFEVPITLTVYSNDAGEPGTVITRQTVNEQLAYRPSADPSCTTAPYVGGFLNTEGNCVNGDLQPISFNLAGVTLPEEVIVSVAYNTTTSGYGTGTAAADSVNVALNGPATIGTTLREDEGSYFASGVYGSANDVFGFQADEEPGETEGFEPAIAVTATN